MEEESEHEAHMQVLDLRPKDGEWPTTPREAWRRRWKWRVLHLLPQDDKRRKRKRRKRKLPKSSSARARRTRKSGRCSTALSSLAACSCAWVSLGRFCLFPFFPRKGGLGRAIWTFFYKPLVCAATCSVSWCCLRVFLRSILDILPTCPLYPAVTSASVVPRFPLGDGFM